MACRAATLFTLLLSYQASSKGALSPPLNLSVELLDFQAFARWLPGPGNPKGTRYSLEFIEIEHFSSSPWNQPEDCTNTTSTQCYLNFTQKIMTEYFVRVEATWKEERSEWTCLSRSFQPYKYTLLSAPTLEVSADKYSIRISLSHPVQSMMGVRMKFSVDLFQMTDSNTAASHIAQNITTQSSTGFVSLPPGRYCINASALLTTEGTKRNQNATMCVHLHPDPKEGYVWVFIVAVLPLLSIPAVICLILIYCYVKPSKSSCIPKAMEIFEGTGMVRVLNPEDPRALPISWIFTEDCMSVHQESEEDSSQGSYVGSQGSYGGFRGFYGGSWGSYGGSWGSYRGSHGPYGKYMKGLLEQIIDVAEYGQDTPPVRDLYSTAAKLEEDLESPAETECLTLHDTTSCRDAIPLSGQNSSSFVQLYDEEIFDEYFEPENSDAVIESNYEPRPDPCWNL